jgi:hypothetical protein
MGIAERETSSSDSNPRAGITNREAAQLAFHMHKLDSQHRVPERKAVAGDCVHRFDQTGPFGGNLARPQPRGARTAQERK